MKMAENETAKNSKIKAVIFDMDGVIIDSEEYHRQTTRNTMKQFGVEMGQDEMAKFAGGGVLDMLKKVQKKYEFEADIAKVAVDKADYFMELIENQEIEIPGVRELITALKNKGYKVALATSNFRRVAEHILLKLNMNETFDRIVCAEDIENFKPHPQIFLLAAERMNLKPENCMVIEDSEKGVNAAKSAGMKCVAFLNKHSINQNTSAADYSIKDYKDFNFEWLV